VVPCVDPHEPHHLAHARVHQGVRQRERQVLLVERARRLGLGGIDHHVRQPNGDRFTRLYLAVLPDRHVGADLDRASLVVEEPEAVATAGRGEGVGLADQLHAVTGQLRRQGVDVG
jgi:hypothetical protein